MKKEGRIEGSETQQQRGAKRDKKHATKLQRKFAASTRRENARRAPKLKRRAVGQKRIEAPRTGKNRSCNSICLDGRVPECYQSAAVANRVRCCVGVVSSFGFVGFRVSVRFVSRFVSFRFGMAALVPTKEA